jgi:hypothetical protein
MTRHTTSRTHVHVTGSPLRPSWRLLLRFMLPSLLAISFAVEALGQGSPMTATAHAPIEAHFDLPGLTGNPFDYTENDVRVAFHQPGGKAAEIPAFFDGGTTWRVRYMPPKAGKYTVARVTRNGAEIHPTDLAPTTFTVAEPPRPGFVRIDPKHKDRFAFEDGSPYFPLGHNAAWKSGPTADIPEIFAKMATVGENWARVWMCHWDGKNLDWPMGRRVEPGRLDLEVARHWDAIVDAAAKNGVYFQMTLQHHGPYSSTTDSNWGENPWNKKNGGFLETPEQFFTDAHARALTRAKYRYIVARWGYSPNILAWELFNEVQWTDAIKNGHADTVAAWHKEMAEFLRAQDPNRHLVTTSSDSSIPGLYDAADYVQPHAYPPDPVSGVAAMETDPRGRPIFFGEFGPSGSLMDDDGGFLRRMLWSSLMLHPSGAAQYWTWDLIDRKDLYPLFRAATGYVKASGLAAHVDLRPVRPEVTTARSGAVSFGPGGGWGKAEKTEFTVAPSGNADGVEHLPSFFQGKAHQDMFPSATLHVTYKEPGTFRVSVRQSAKAGAHVVIKVDGAVAAERDFPAAESDQRVRGEIEAAVPAGAHTIQLENTGADWVVVSRMTLTPYGPALTALGKASTDRAVLWLYRAEPDASQPGVTGKVTLNGLKAGAYAVSWWDTQKGVATVTQTVHVTAGQPLVLDTPAVTDDIAAFITPSR